MQNAGKEVSVSPKDAAALTQPSTGAVRPNVIIEINAGPNISLCLLWLAHSFVSCGFLESVSTAIAGQ
jgi:hypothetical protein